MPIFSKSLPSIRQLRTLTTRTRLEQGQHGSNSSGILMAKPWFQDWPVRVERFAGGQKQPSRSLSSNRRISHLDTGMFQPVTLPDNTYVPALPSRNRIVAAQNAARRRSTRYTDSESQYHDRSNQRSQRMDEVMVADREYEGEAEAEGESEIQAQQESRIEHAGGGRPEMMDEAHDYESDLEVRSVRETVFGPPEDNDEDERMRAQADEDLLRRVATTNRYEAPAPSISRKVISPYNSYRSHRTRWAEFRHSMIYGRSAF